jgi:uncharacterized protein (TIGR00369 family)
VSDAPVPRLSADDIQGHFDRSPFTRFLGLRVTAVDHDRGELSVTMPMRPEIERGVGTAQFHGGPIAAFIDCVGDFAVALVVGGGVPTINIRIDYLKPAVGASITGTARVRRSGRTVTVVDVDVYDEAGALVAVGRGTYSSQRG